MGFGFAPDPALGLSAAAPPRLRLACCPEAAAVGAAELNPGSGAWAESSLAAATRRRLRTAGGGLAASVSVVLFPAEFFFAELRGVELFCVGFFGVSSWVLF